MAVTLRAVAALAALATACGGAGARAGDSRDLRVLVYNIHAGADAHGAPNLDRVASLVRDTRADIVLLQEVDRGTRRSNGADQPALLAQATGMHATFGKSLDYQGGEYGIAVLSRWTPSASRVIPLPVEPPQERAGGSREPRAALVVAVETPAGGVRVINTHLDPSGNDRWRRQEAERILSLVDSLHETHGAVLAGGDLNSTPESAVQETIRSRGLRDAWMLCGRGDGLTFPADSAVKRIDYLFLTGRVSCSEARVLRSDASDHRPVLFTLRLR